MIVVCLGWGSLVWDPRGLPIRREWFKDGPFAPVEFTRMSSDGRVTLVIEPSAKPVRLLWVQMIPDDVETAREALRDREGIPQRDDWQIKIGTWKKGDQVPHHIPGIADWSKSRGIEAVIWTALNSKFNGEDRTPSRDEVVAYLRGLEGTKREHAKQYIVNTPAQIDTDYRRAIEAALGWSRATSLGQ